MHPLGSTRTTVQHNHAFIAPDSHVTSPLPGWTNTTGIILISPQMGAGFCQYFAHVEAGGTAGDPSFDVERFIYVLDGQLTLTTTTVATMQTELLPGEYAYLPPNHQHHLQAIRPSRLLGIERPYSYVEGVDLPHVIVGDEQAVKSAPFLGDPDAQLKTLLPTYPTFDMAVNLFTFQPGAALPFVETHIMEHGLLLLEGQGIYRLAESWYPIQAGDVLWMGAYCPQWFAAIGKTSSAYLYYKDVNRDPLEFIL